MAEDEDEGNPYRRAHAVSISRTPSHASHQEKQRQKVGEGRICSMVGVFGLWESLLDISGRFNEGGDRRTFLSIC